MKICFWDINVGDVIKATGKAQNAYIITSKNQKVIGLKRKKDGIESQMDTGRALDMINQYSNIESKPVSKGVISEKRKRGRPKKYSKIR
jgi:hypothetical protein